MICMIAKLGKLEGQIKNTVQWCRLSEKYHVCQEDRHLRPTANAMMSIHALAPVVGSNPGPLKSITETENKHSHLKDTLRACHVGRKLHIERGGADLTERYILLRINTDWYFSNSCTIFDT